MEPRPPSAAVVRKRTDAELMPPPPPAKRIKRPKKILDEESYARGLAHIIARDFFPGILESETKREYLEALRSEDAAWITSAGRRLQDLMTPGRRGGPGTPAGPGLRAQAFGETPSARDADTPASVASNATSATARATAGPPVNTNVSLTAFQALHTSEDNESFYKLLDRQNQKRKEKHAWAWNGNRLPSKQRIAQQEVKDRLARTRSLVDDRFGRDGLAVADKDDRPAQPDTWKSAGPLNGLMFVPDGVDGEMETPAQRAQAESKMGPKAIHYEGTRMPDPCAAPRRPASPTPSAVRDAIAGRPRDSDLNSSIVGGGGDGGETPRVNGYAFVDDEEEEDEDDSSVGGPPSIIDLGPGDATPNPFRIADVGDRESLHHRMVDRISESKRTASRNGMAGRAGPTPLPRFSSSPSVSAAGLTPAGQRLWGKLGTPARGTPMGPGMGVFDTPKSGRMPRIAKRE